jgi:hypothetical protein
MALPQHKTTLSIFRSILGSFHGNEARFAEKIGRSRSWLKKASCGEIPLTPEIARVIAYETGVCPQWLLSNDTAAPAVDRLGKPYTLETYAAYRQADTERINFEDWGDAERGFCRSIQELIAVLTSAGLSNRGGFFQFLLEEFVEDAKKRFSTVEIRGWKDAAKYGLEVARYFVRCENSLTPEQFRAACIAQSSSVDAGRSGKGGKVQRSAASNPQSDSAPAMRGHPEGMKKKRKSSAKPAAKPKPSSKPAARSKPKSPTKPQAKRSRKK